VDGAINVIEAAQDAKVKKVVALSSDKAYQPISPYGFSKAMAEGVVLTKKDAAAAKRAIAKFVKVDDPKILDASYDAYASYLETNLAVRDDVIRSELDYLDEKEFPKARSAKTREFYDNTFIETLDKAGFFASLGLGRQK